MTSIYFFFVRLLVEVLLGLRQQAGVLCAGAFAPAFLGALPARPQTTPAARQRRGLAAKLAALLAVGGGRMPALRAAAAEFAPAAAAATAPAAWRRILGAILPDWGWWLPLAAVAVAAALTATEEAPALLGAAALWLKLLEDRKGGPGAVIARTPAGKIVLLRGKGAAGQWAEIRIDREGDRSVQGTILRTAQAPPEDPVVRQRREAQEAAAAAKRAAKEARGAEKDALQGVAKAMPAWAHEGEIVSPAGFACEAKLCVERRRATGSAEVYHDGNWAGGVDLPATEGQRGTLAALPPAARAALPPVTAARGEAAEFFSSNLAPSRGLVPPNHPVPVAKVGFGRVGAGWEATEELAGGWKATWRCLPAQLLEDEELAAAAMAAPVVVEDGVFLVPDLSVASVSFDTVMAQAGATVAELRALLAAEGSFDAALDAAWLAGKPVTEEVAALVGVEAGAARLTVDANSVSLRDHRGWRLGAAELAIASGDAGERVLSTRFLGLGRGKLLCQDGQELVGELLAGAAGLLMEAHGPTGSAVKAEGRARDAAAAWAFAVLINEGALVRKSGIEGGEAPVRSGGGYGAPSEHGAGGWFDAEMAESTTTSTPTRIWEGRGPRDEAWSVRVEGNDASALAAAVRGMAPETLRPWRVKSDCQEPLGCAEAQALLAELPPVPPTVWETGAAAAAQALLDGTPVPEMELALLEELVAKIGTYDQRLEARILRTHVQRMRVGGAAGAAAARVALESATPEAVADFLLARGEDLHAVQADMRDAWQLGQRGVFDWLHVSPVGDGAEEAAVGVALRALCLPDVTGELSPALREILATRIAEMAEAVREVIAGRVSKDLRVHAATPNAARYLASPPWVGFVKARAAEPTTNPRHRGRDKEWEGDWSTPAASAERRFVPGPCYLADCSLAGFRGVAVDLSRVRQVHVDGLRRWVEGNGHPFFDLDAAAERLILGALNPAEGRWRALNALGCHVVSAEVGVSVVYHASENEGRVNPISALAPNAWRTREMGIGAAAAAVDVPAWVQIQGIGGTYTAVVPAAIYLGNSRVVDVFADAIGRPQFFQERITPPERSLELRLAWEVADQGEGYAEVDPRSDAERSGDDRVFVPGWEGVAFGGYDDGPSRRAAYLSPVASVHLGGRCVGVGAPCRTVAAAWDSAIATLGLGLGASWLTWHTTQPEVKPGQPAVWELNLHSGRDGKIVRWPGAPAPAAAPACVIAPVAVPAPAAPEAPESCPFDQNASPAVKRAYNFWSAERLSRWAWEGLDRTEREVLEDISRPRREDISRGRLRQLEAWAADGRLEDLLDRVAEQGRVRGWDGLEPFAPAPAAPTVEKTAEAPVDLSALKARFGRR